MIRSLIEEVLDNLPSMRPPPFWSGLDRLIHTPPSGSRRLPAPEQGVVSQKRLCLPPSPPPLVCLYIFFELRLGGYGSLLLQVYRCPVLFVLDICYRLPLSSPPRLSRTNKNADGRLRKSYREGQKCYQEVVSFLAVCNRLGVLLLSFALRNSAMNFYTFAYWRLVTYYH